MKRREFINTMGAGALGLSMSNCAHQGGVSAKISKKPNIVVIMADDLGYGDLSCLNPQSKINTPQIDRLAYEGVKFTDAHSPSAVCTPTRYGLLTGRYAWRTHLKSGVLWGYSEPLISSDRLTLPGMLQQHGYRTACIGKWHLGWNWAERLLINEERENADELSEHEKIDYSEPITGGPTDVGFDYFYGIPASLDMDPYVWVENDRVVEAPTERTEGKPYPAFYREGPIAPDFDFYKVLPTITDKSISFMERHRANEPERPFFMYVPLAAPHTPWVPNDYVKGESEAGVYGDFVTEVDHNVGRILNKLDELGITGNTLVIFTSDNGAHESRIGEFDNGVSGGDDGGAENFGHEANYVFRGQKADVWDGGHRVPFLVRWPGHIEPETDNDELIGLNDIMMTCAEIVNHPMAENAAEDSVSFLPALKQQNEEPLRDHLITHSLRGVFCMRKGPWKFIDGRGSGGFTQPQKIEPGPGEPLGQLYNLDDDISEQNNLYLERPDMVEMFKTELEKYKERGHTREMNPLAMQ